MDTEQLRTFAEVARLSSVTRAARKLRLQQPTVSHRLAALERAVGVPLFERLGNSLTLTSSGRSLLPRAVQIAAATEQAIQAAREEAGLSALRLHVGCAETPATYLLPERLRDLRTLNPELEVTLTVGNASHVLAVTLSGEVDVALLTDREQHPSLVGETLRDDRFVVAVAADDDWAARSFVTVADLVTRRLLLRERGAGTRAFVDAALRANSLHPGETLEVASLEALKRMAEAGVGVAVVPSLAVDREAAEGRLRTIRLETDGNYLSYRLMRLKDRSPTAAVDLFRTVMGLGDSNRPSPAHRSTM